MPEVSTPPSAGRAPAGSPLSPEPRRESRLPLWVTGLAPLVLLAGLVLVFLRFGPVGVFRAAYPPVEELTLERIRLPRPGVMEVSVVNGGPEAVTIAQVMVDDANWVHTVNGSRRVERLDRRTVRIPYPWVEGEPHTVTVVTHTGLTFSTEVPVATQSPPVDARYLGTFALLGIYAGVIPVFIGLLWLPFVRAVERKWVDFFLSLTVGLLVFLGVEALEEALRTSGSVPGAYQGVALVVFGALGTPLVIGAIGEWRARVKGARSPLWVAALIAFGIGLHNLGEGLAIGTSYATGEIALGTFLVVGFLLHNTTEGLGIVTPLAGERPRLSTLVLLGALAASPPLSAPGSAGSPIPRCGPRSSSPWERERSRWSSTSSGGCSRADPPADCSRRSTRRECSWGCW